MVWSGLGKPTTLSSGAFAGCFGLDSLNLPANIKSIGLLAFAECKRMLSVELPIDVKVGDGAFANCTVLSSVRFKLRVSYAFLAWALGNSRNRSNWQITTLRGLRNVLRLIAILAIERPSVGIVDPGCRRKVFHGCMTFWGRKT